MVIIAFSWFFDRHAWSPSSHDVPTEAGFEAPTTPTLFPRRGNFVATWWELLSRYRARLRGDVCPILCSSCGPAVTIRVSLVFVRADSSSPVVMVTGSPDLPERHSGFVRASRFQRSAFDLLRLPSSLRLSAPCAM
jgi:hypothetical protein